MGSWSRWISFIDECIDLAPNEPGVYKITKGARESDIIYIGKHKKSVRARLRQHYNGNGDPCVYKNLRRYKLFFSTMITDDPDKAEENALKNFEKKFGRLPECNDVS